MNTQRQLEREMVQTLRIMIRNMQKQKAQAKREQMWSQVATSDAYIAGLQQAVEVVRIVMQRTYE